MNKGFWEKLDKPIMALAPLADVTDAPFRSLIAKYGKPDVMFTEFVSADGLCSAGRSVLLKDLIYTQSERPIVAQIFGSKPENIEKAAALVCEHGFDGIDINMGCPDRSVEKQGAGACLIKNKKEAKEIVRAAKRGAGSLPVSVKTRTGYHKDEIESWVGALLEEELAVITIHARTRKEMSKVPARWENVKEAALLAEGTGTLILGNGDVRDIRHARERAQETGADGIMLGRAIFGNPWLFAEYTPLLEEKLRVMVEHTNLFEELLGDVKNFAIMKKHYKAYVNGFDGAKELRMELMEAHNAKEVEKLVEDFLKMRGV
ncbi:MAG: tRNA-dihydrouridine synthase [Candidatus Paceibacterota bacterium]